MRILEIEGERAMAESLEQGLQAEGFAVDVAGDGQEGLWLAGEVDYDAIILAFGLRVGCRRSHSVLDLSSSDHILPILRGASTL